MPFFFFSAKIYSLPRLENYHKRKASSLAAHFQHDENASLEEKWDRLISKFSEAIRQREDNSAVFLNQLGHFKIRRLQVAVNAHSLSLTQVVRYFEDFYFLYVNEHEQYQLNKDEKTQLINSIKDALPVCETGINGYFYELLQNYQKDEDWVVNALVKNRCDLVRLLYTQYEANHVVAAVYSVHVYNYLVILANQKGFALPMQEVIADIYEDQLNKDAIKYFFEQKFLQYQQKYQQDMLITLSEELMCSLSKIMPEQQWGDESIEVTPDFYSNLTTFLTLHFKTFNTLKIANMLENLCSYDEESNRLLMKGRRQTQACLMESIMALLYTQDYFLSPERLIENPSLQSSALINPNIRLKDILAIHQAFQTQDQKSIQTYSQALRQYPEICISAIIENPMLYQYVSPYIKKDTQFIDAVVSKIQTLLQEALDNKQEEKIENLIDVLELVTAGELIYLKKLSPRIRQEPSILIRFGDIDFPYHDFNESVSMADFFKALKKFSMTDLMRINTERKQFSLKPLPFIDEYELALNAFISEIRKDIENSEGLDEHELKRKACEIEDFKFFTNPFRPLRPISFLAKNRNVFEAFIEYQAYQFSFNNIFHLLIKLIINLVELAKYACIAALSIYLILNFTPLVAMFIDPYTNLLFVLAGLCYGLCQLFNSRTFAFAAIALLVVSLLDVGLNILFIIQCAASLLYAAKELVQLLKNMSYLIETIFKTGCSFVFKETTFGNIEDSCDSIIFHLEMINEVSAMQKASVLRTIHEQMKQDFGNNLTEKPYDIEYQGKAYQLSFKDVCNMSRSSKDEFCITASNCIIRFFKPQTVSSKRLESVSFCV